MSYPQRRMTRSQCARVAAALAKAEETGESFGPQPRRNPNKADSSWISNVIDLTISKRVGDQATTGDEVESMAPGGGLGRVKARFVKNHTSLTPPRMMNRVHPDDPSETSCKQSSYVPDKMQVPSKAATETQAVAPRTESTANRELSKAATETQVVAPRFESTTNREPPKSRLAPTIGGQDPSSGRPKKKVSQTSQTVSPQAQPPIIKALLRQMKPPQNHRQRTINHNQPAVIYSQRVLNHNHPVDSRNHPVINHNPLTINLSQTDIKPHQPALRSNQTAIKHSHRPRISPHLACETRKRILERKQMKSIRTTQTRQRCSFQRLEKKCGPTMGRGLMKAGSNGKKIKTEVDPAIGRPKERLESAKLSSQVGVVARDVLPVVRKWKEIDVQNALDPCIDHMQIHLDVNMDNPGVRQCVIERLKNSSRQQRYRLHVHYKKFGNVREAKQNKPTSVNDQQQWEILCDHFNSSEFQHQSEANSNNRKKMQAKHVTGRTPFTIIQNEISLKNGDYDMIELYKYTHANVKGKWSSAVAKKNWDFFQQEQMNELRDLYAAEGVEKREQEIVTEVVGRANGYIKGLGYGPKPPGKQSQLQQELEETRVELGESKTKVATYKSKVDAMNEELTQQAAQMAKLMAYMEGSGSKNNDQEQQTNRNEANQVDEHEGDGQGNEQEDEQEDVEQDEDEDDDLSVSQYSTEPTI
ncbi:hypothetical protein CASFOL_017718 [Castilleja foliolosa]|uniref:Transposase n=1 Tax=Castilleja foliolosa TaxID=1961234 RepID=A0ABD3D9I3_9LAMI